MRKSRTFPIGLSRGKGKLELVELCGESSAQNKNSPGIDFNVSSIKTALNYFIYEGKINEKNCSFRIDTGSDVSVVNSKFVDKKKVLRGILI